MSDGRGPIEIPGPVRSSYLGERMLRELGCEDDRPTVGRWMAALHRVQWFGGKNGEHFAGLFEATSKNSGEELLFAVWTPADAWGMPDVPWVVISAESDGDDVIFVPAQAVETIAGDRWEWLDEKQRVVFGFDEASWPELRRRAREFQTPP